VYAVYFSSSSPPLWQFEKEKPDYIASFTTEAASVPGFSQVPPQSDFIRLYWPISGFH
jgi:hypothetical protein